MNKFIPTGPYTYRRSTDGCDETFDVVDGPSGECITSFHFWEAEAQAKALARWVVAALNLTHALAEVLSIQQSDPEAESTAKEAAKTLRRERAERFANQLDSQFHRATTSSLIDLLTDAQHWCDREFVDFDDAVRQATGHFNRETNS